MTSCTLRVFVLGALVVSGVEEAAPELWFALTVSSLDSYEKRRLIGFVNDAKGRPGSSAASITFTPEPNRGFGGRWKTVQTRRLPLGAFEKVKRGRKQQEPELSYGSGAMQVVPGVHRLTHGVSNFYLIEDGGKLVLIDAGVPGDWNLFVEALSSLGRTPRDLEAVLLTHAHSDHTGFAERAGSNMGAAIWIHEADSAVAKGAKQGNNEGKLRGYLRYGESWRTLFGLMRRGGLKIIPILEVSTFADGQTIEVVSRPRAVHVPGHTPGTAALLLEGRRVLLTGDALVTRNPLTGRRGPQIMPRALNRDSQQALGSLGKLENLAADLILPGHGDPWTQGVADAVQRARTAGFS